MRWNGSQLRSGVLLLGIWLEGLEWYSESWGGLLRLHRKQRIIQKDYTCARSREKTLTADRCEASNLTC